MSGKTMLIAFFSIICNGVVGQTEKTGAYVNLPDSKTLFSASKNAYISCADLSNKETDLIIVFWVSTCTPCIKELNAINKRIDEWKKAYNFEIFAISSDKCSNRNDAIALWKKHHWKFDIFFDTKHVLRNKLLSNWHGVPQLMVIDKNNKIIYHKFGYKQNDETYVTRYLTKNQIE